jgi:hypothetical protein
MTHYLALITPSDSDGCATYRSVGPLNQLGFPYSINPRLPFLNHETIFFQRPWHLAHLDLVTTAKALGRRVIIDWDDDLTNLPPTHPFFTQFNTDNRTHEIAALADHIITSTPHLASTLASHISPNIPITVIPNAIDPAFRKFATNRPAPNIRPIAIWRGSATHEQDILAHEHLITDTAKTHEIIFIGAKPPPRFSRFTHIESLPYEQYMVFLHYCRPDLFIIPLEDHPFNHSKSDVCAQEAFAVGARIVHSGVGEYAKYPQFHWEPPRYLDDPNINPVRKAILYS